MSLARAREFAVLTLLAAHPAHGYEIAKAVSSGPLALLGLSRAAVYAILDRFRDRGWVEERAEPGGAYPDRTVLSLTPTARAALAGEAAALGAGPLPATVPLAALTMFVDSGGGVDRTALDAMISRRAEALATRAKDDGHAGSATAKLWQRTLEAELSVLRELRDTAA